MKIAVLTLTRDRLELTKRCIESLRNNAGCDFDHYIWDNASSDGTREWINTQDDLHAVFTASTNKGISTAMNHLIRTAEREGQPPFDPYDVIVKIDNDCEVLTPNTLRDVSELVDTYGLLLSPTINGLRHPPATIGHSPLSLGGTLVDEKAQIGGVFLAAPASLYESFRYCEKNPMWGGDDVEVCAYWRSLGRQCGYVRGYDANHATDEQQAAFPAYFERKALEMAA